MKERRLRREYMQAIAVEGYLFLPSPTTGCLTWIPQVCNGVNTKSKKLFFFSLFPFFFHLNKTERVD